jgi:hypothetical protein
MSIPSEKSKNKTSSSLKSLIKTTAAVEAMVPDKNAVQVEAKIKPPPRAVKNIRDLIYWEYAKLIAKTAGLGNQYPFIMNRFMKLKNGEMKFSNISKDDAEQMKRERACIYCGCTENLTFDHIIPTSKGGPDIPSNLVLACSNCNSLKKDRDIFEWYYLVKKEQEIPILVWSKYLKLVWDFHVAHRTIDQVDINKDGEFNVLDLGAIFRKR